MNIAIFASGKGSNADNICHYFSNHPSFAITLIITDRKHAGVIDVAKKYKIEFLYINREGWENANELVHLLRKKNISLIVLAGFLKLVPREIVEAFRNRIINIHPALLPKYGGKGMYGHHVHQAVAAAAEKETGITIHFVDEHFDNGDIIFQATTQLNSTESPESIAARIHDLEMKHFPHVIEQTAEMILKMQN